MRGKCRECGANCATTKDRNLLGDVLKRSYRVGWEYADELTCDPCCLKLVHQAIRESKEPPPKAA